MRYITIDGDYIGQKISAFYLNNDASSLKDFNDIVQSAVKNVGLWLASEGFELIFCAADGVAARHIADSLDELRIFRQISNISGQNFTFSMGTGANLRESYIALLSAKSNGRARMCKYQDLFGNV